MWLWQTWLRSRSPCSPSLGLHLPFVAGPGEHVEIDRAIDKSRSHFICLCFSALSSGSFISVFSGTGIIRSGSVVLAGWRGGSWCTELSFQCSGVVSVEVVFSLRPALVQVSWNRSTDSREVDMDPTLSQETVLDTYWQREWSVIVYQPHSRAGAMLRSN